MTVLPVTAAGGVQSRRPGFATRPAAGVPTLNPEPARVGRSHALSLAAWSEFVSYTRLSEHLELFQRRGAALFLAVRPDGIGDNDLLKLLRRAQAMGIEVRAWILLSDAAGYWPNARNAEEVRRQVQRFVAWTGREGVAVPWIVLDMEPPLDLTRELNHLFGKRHLLELARTLRRTFDLQVFRQSVDQYNALVDELHGHAIRVMGVSTPLVLDDLRAGNLVYQEFGQIPVSPVHWDELSFMVYRSIFSDVLGSRVSTRLTYEYARAAASFFPGRAGIAVGIVGSVSKTPTPPGLLQPSELAADVAAARAGGIDKVHVFSFDGILQLPRPQDWLNVDVPGQEPPRDRSTAVVRGLIRLGNGFLKYLRPRSAVGRH